MTDSYPTQTCANHPQVETNLRCNRCEKLICTKCAVPTPTGYRCKECIRGQKKIFDTARWQDYLLAVPAAFFLALLGSLFIPRFFLLVIFLSPIAGMIIGESVRFLARKRRAVNLSRVVVIATLAGCAPAFLWALFTGIFSITQYGAQGLSGMYPIIMNGIYLFLTTSTAYYRLSGKDIKV